LAAQAHTVPESPLLLHPAAQLLKTNFGAMLRGPDGSVHLLSQSQALALVLCNGVEPFADIVRGLADLYRLPPEEVEGEVRRLYERHLAGGLLLPLPAPLPEPFYDHRPFIFEPETDPRAVHPTTLTTLALQLSAQCVLACAYCYTDSLPGRGDNMPTSLALRLLREGRELGATGAILGGGDPLIHPDAAAIAEHAVMLGYRNITVSTKATIVTRELAAALRRAGLTHIQVSLDSWIPEEVERLTGSSPALSRALQGVFYLMEQNLRVNVNSVVTGLNVDSIPDLISSLARWGISSFQTPRVVAVGRGADVPPATPAQLARLGSRLERLRAELPGLDLPVITNESLTQCGGGRLGVFVLADGRVIPCDLILTLLTDTEVLGNVNEASLADIWDGERMRAFRRPRVDHPQCLQCSTLTVCGGGCRVRSWIATGDMNRPDPLCRKITVGKH